MLFACKFFLPRNENQNFIYKPLLSRELVCFKAWTGRKQIFNSEWNCTGYKNTKKKNNSCWKIIVKIGTKKYSLFLTPRIHPHAFVYGARFISNNSFTLILDIQMLPFAASSWLKFLILVENFSICVNSSSCQGTRAILVDLFMLFLVEFYSTARLSPCCGFCINSSSCLACCWLFLSILEYE